MPTAAAGGVSFTPFARCCGARLLESARLQRSRKEFADRIRGLNLELK
ncbi:MAG: hypothetical protein IT514_10100 [Burkholderiales bacterium]|nr:hypothetical protein [Burkholderiales bacterium]